MTDPTPRGLRLVHRGAQALLARVLLIAAAVLLGAAAVRAAGAPGRWLLGLAVTAALLLAATVAAGAALRRIPPRTVLVFDLAEPVQDQPAGDPIARMTSRGRMPLRDIVEALERAGADPRVQGLVVRIVRPATGLADVQELRDAVAAFRSTGKFAVAFADSFGEFANGALGYYLACSFDEIVLQPSGDVGLTGVAAEVTFVRGTLDKLGIVPQIDHRHEYKSAKDLLTETSFTPAHREAVSGIVDSIYTQVVAGIAAGRGLTEGEVRGLIDHGPMIGDEAVQSGLVDRLAYRDEVVDAVKQRGGDGARTVALAAYARRTRRSGRRGRQTAVALIHCSGPIVVGRSRPSLFGRTMGSDTVTAAFRAAVENKRVRAILFRVDSPGGSYVASDAIWREVARAREAGKPVVVSMGNVAGSGGYFVAMGADRIVAHPATLTGSIGVVSGKAVVSGLRERLGVSVDEVHAGENALLWSPLHPYTADQWEVVHRSLDRVYDDFVDKAARGRRMERERMHEHARGRVWTGAAARDRGLVDDLGGYAAARRALRATLDLSAEERLRLIPFPRRQPFLVRLFGRNGGDPFAALGGPAALRMSDLRLRW
jgi:protease IV